ncbi:MAG TPA: DUF2868 domain-containing protein [Pseudomonas sp.]|nr:DUF2868 domain-containing protein [Pseudomonas sp.]HTO17626.1 DUF2868 domain-containing protein [Pseudomonas sp.]
MSEAVSSSPLSRLDRLWLCEAIRLREEQAGPLEDGEANRRARLAGPALEQRIESRALLLAERDGQLVALRHWHQGARLALLVLALFALLSGAGLAFAALGDGQRPVNVFWALGSLLGLHVLTLLGWLGGLLFTRDAGGALGRLWLWLSEKLARDAQAAQLAPALLVVLQRQRLARWGLGALVHGLWLLALLSALALLLAMLSTRRYGFVWETTLLGADSFVALTQTLGALPALLGFSLPDIAQIRASGERALVEESARQAWAGWLLGVLLVYGILPRLLLALFCRWRWRRGLRRLRLPLDAPGYLLLRERLQPASERLGVRDAAPTDLPEPQAGAFTSDAEGVLLAGIELDPAYPWPPVLPEGVGNAGVLDSREQRRLLLERLAQRPAARLLLACDPRRSPDRGTLALLGELSRSAVATRVWLLPVDADAARLDDWRAALQRLGLAEASLDWLEKGHD